MFECAPIVMARIGGHAQHALDGGVLRLDGQHLAAQYGHLGCHHPTRCHEPHLGQLSQPLRRLSFDTHLLSEGKYGFVIVPNVRIERPQHRPDMGVVWLQARQRLKTIDIVLYRGTRALGDALPDFVQAEVVMCTKVQVSHDNRQNGYHHGPAGTAFSCVDTATCDIFTGLDRFQQTTFDSHARRRVLIIVQFTGAMRALDVGTFIAIGHDIGHFTRRVTVIDHQAASHRGRTVRGIHDRHCQRSQQHQTPYHQQNHARCSLRSSSGWRARTRCSSACSSGSSGSACTG
ncbi:acyl-CoA dehydrogenases [Zymobacter palmae]|uniref:Acyl-CoA dehydrogenases n=1 Tax=Zymobacter palmae TaxID=33074 RepID=A0A348HFX4_9GAMM|nr:acyl-CoA dehydrogenases [Zymobacter palmae]